MSNLIIDVPGSSPLAAQIVEMPADDNWEHLHSGWNMACGITSNDKIRAWIGPDGRILLAYFMSSDSDYEQKQVKCFHNLIWKLTELERLGYITLRLDEEETCL
jgi:hypothetical protein